MTLRWSIVHDDKLVVAHVTGPIQPEEIRSVYAAMTAQDALLYRKLVDLSFAPLEIGLAGIAILTKVIDAAAQGLSRGPAAFVVNRDMAQEIVEIVDRRLALDRPLRIFRDTESAMRWLDEIAPPGGP